MRASIVAAATIVFAASLHAQDWNQWRGPERTGEARAFKAPSTWPDKPTRQWRIEAGEGHSSPIVAGTRVYLHSRIGDNDVVTAYHLDSGKQLWRDTYPAPYQVNPAATSHGKGVKSTPVVAGGRLFAFGIGGILSAYDGATGKLAWRKDFKKEFPATAPEFGTAMSPIVHEGRVIVHAGGPKNGALLAFDAATGTQRWAWKGDGPAYSSPIVSAIGGVHQLITQTQSHIVALAPDDGKLLWQIPFTTEYEQNILTPVIFEGLLIYSGVSKPLTAVRLVRTNGEWTAERAWENADLPMYMSTPVEDGGVLYGLTHRNRGQFFAADAKTGKTLWTTRGREGENAALVVAGDAILATTTEGELVVMRKDSKAFAAVKRYTVADSPIWAHPVPAGRGVLIKDAGTLAYWTF